MAPRTPVWRCWRKIRDGFHRLCRDYALSGIRFTAEQIHIIRDDADQRIRTKSEHEACADLITDIVRRLIADTDTALHVSLAGGRLLPRQRPDPLRTFPGATLSCSSADIL